MSNETGAHTSTIEDYLEARKPPEDDQDLWKILAKAFGRLPRQREMEAWKRRLQKVRRPERFVKMLANSRHASEAKFVFSKNPGGHFFSPVVDPEIVVDYVRREREKTVDEIPGVDIDIEAMEEFWRRNQDAILATPFPEQQDPAFRYFSTGGPYPFGDATILRAMIHDLKPKRIIEIGSGFSTAAMLDSADEFALDELKITCIEPYPTRLLSVLRKEDQARVVLIEEGVEHQDLAMFEELDQGDILFIDSTHVMKTGSDVHFEIFHILPRLKPGVVIHFHDCRFPFEYSDVQIFQKNYSWNEVYAVRALLMYSNRFKVIFSASALVASNSRIVAETYPKLIDLNPGSGLWIEVVDQ